MLSIPKHVNPQRQPPLASNILPVPPPSRQKREAPDPEGPNENPRIAGDRELAMEYHSALLLAANGQRNVTINTLAPESTFGQWWAQLSNAFK